MKVGCSDCGKTDVKLVERPIDVKTGMDNTVDVCEKCRRKWIKENLDKKKKMSNREKWGHYWSDEEIETLKEYYPVMTIPNIIRLGLLNRTSRGIEDKARKMHIRKVTMKDVEKTYRKNSWRVKDDNYLKYLYQRMAVHKIFLSDYFPGRTENAIKARVKNLGLKKLKL